MAGTYQTLPLTRTYAFIERGRGWRQDLPDGYVLHVWSLSRGDRSADFIATDDALENSSPYEDLD